MDDNQITAGLCDLAEQAGTITVDIDDVMARAAGIGRRRKAIAAAAVGTAAVVAAFTVLEATVGLGPHGGPDRAPVADPSRTSTPFPEQVSNAGSRKLTDQLDAVRGSLIPARFALAQDSGSIAYSAPPLTFEYFPAAHFYVAAAQLTDDQGPGNLSFVVTRSKPASEFGCPPKQVASHCVTTTLPDGTRLTTYDENDGLTIRTGYGFNAIRPDGTEITGTSDIGVDTLHLRPTPVLNAAQLAKFATVFRL